jgi:serine/threonine protein kinase
MIEKERWQKIESIYHTALSRNVEQRETYLDQACGGDSEIRREVDSLLDFDEKAGAFIESPAIAVAARALAAEESQGDQPYRPADIGPYHFLRLLGQGGTGDVYLAIDTRLGRKVAIKLLASELGNDDERISRFKQEARATSTLNHQNIVTIFEIGEVENQHYIVTEYVEGDTLRVFLKNRSGKLTVKEALSIALQLVDALDAAHRAGIIHRDIKPDNIIIRNDGFVKILDFGIAKLTSPGHSNQTDHLTTRTGMVMGTASYMSPEQARGVKVDHRTDIFSVGVLLYEMLSGCKPFAGDTWSDVIAAVLVKEPEPLKLVAPHVPVALQSIVARCLEKVPENRFQSAADLAFSLRSFSESATSSAEPDGRRLRFSAAKVIWIAAVVFVLALSWILLLTKKTAKTPSIVDEKKRVVLQTRKTRLKWVDRSGKELAIVGEPAEYSGPALSANEDQIAVAIKDPEKKSRDLWIVSENSESNAQLTTEPSDDLNPLWTPDNRWIIYTSERDGFRNIYRKRVDNSGAPEPILQAHQDMNVEDISRDGRMLIFNVRNKRDDAPSLEMLSLENAKRTPVTRTASRAARFSPDGRWVAYETSSGIVVRKTIAGSRGQSIEYPITTSGGATTPMWRGDGSELFYLDQHTLTAVQINVSGTRLTVSTPQRLFTADFENEERRNRYVVTKDGQRFLIIVRESEIADASRQ